MSSPRNVLKHKTNFGTSNGRFDHNKRTPNDTNRHGTTINHDAPDIIDKTENSYANNKRPKTGTGRRPEENRKLRDVNPLDANFDVGDSLGKMNYHESGSTPFNGREPHSFVGPTKKRKFQRVSVFEPLDIAKSRQTQGAIPLINNRNNNGTRDIKQSSSGFHSSTEVRNQRINEYDGVVRQTTSTPIPKASISGIRNTDGRGRSEFSSKDKNFVNRREHGEFERKSWGNHCPPPALRKKQHPTSKKMLPKGEKNPQREFVSEAAIVNLCDDKNDSQSISESSVGSIIKSSFCTVSPKDSDCIRTFSVKSNNRADDAKVEKKQKMQIAPSIENRLRMLTCEKLRSPDEKVEYRKKSFESLGSVTVADCLDKVGRKVVNIGKSLSREAGSYIRTLSQNTLLSDSTLDKFNQESCDIKNKGDDLPPYDVGVEPENCNAENMDHQLSNATDSFATNFSSESKEGRKKRSFLRFTKIDNPDLEVGQEKKRGIFGRNGRKKQKHVIPSVIIPGKSLGLAASDREDLTFSTNTPVVAPTSPNMREPLKPSLSEMNGGRDRSYTKSIERSNENKILRKVRETREAKKEKAKELIEIYSSDSESDLAEKRSTRRKTIGALRITIGKKVFRSDCIVSVPNQDEMIMSYTSYQSSKESQQQHLIRLPDDIIEFKYFPEVYEKEKEKEAHNDDFKDIDNEIYRINGFLALRVERTASNNLDQFSAAYEPAKKDSKRSYITIEFRHTDDLLQVIDLLKSTRMSSIICSQGVILEHNRSSNYCKILLRDSQKEGNRRRSSLRLLRNTSHDPVSFLEGKVESDVLLVYPFPGADALDGFEGLPIDTHSLSPRKKNLKSNDMRTCNAKEEVDNKEKSLSRGHVIEIRVSDVLRLDPGEFLNDTLIDFWFQWLWRYEKKENIHVFSSHFYTTLCKEGPAGVQKWTEKKGIDVFKKKFIFMPINKSLHWSLCVIVYPGELEHVPGKRSDDSPTREKTVPVRRPFILFFDSLKSHRRDIVANKVSGWLKSEWKRRLNENRKTSSFQCLEYPQLPIYSPKIPSQSNSWDCGVFICRYGYAMYRLRSESFAFNDSSTKTCKADIIQEIINRGDAFKFSMEDISAFREEFKNLLKVLYDGYDAWNSDQLREKNKGKLNVSKGEQKIVVESENSLKLNENLSVSEFKSEYSSPSVCEILKRDRKASGEAKKTSTEEFLDPLNDAESSFLKVQPQDTSLEPQSIVSGSGIEGYDRIESEQIIAFNPADSHVSSDVFSQDKALPNLEHKNDEINVRSFNPTKETEQKKISATPLKHVNSKRLGSSNVHNVVVYEKKINDNFKTENLNFAKGIDRDSETGTSLNNASSKPITDSSITSVDDVTAYQPDLSHPRGCEKLTPLKSNKNVLFGNNATLMQTHDDMCESPKDNNSLFCDRLATSAKSGVCQNLRDPHIDASITFPRRSVEEVMAFRVRRSPGFAPFKDAAHVDLELQTSSLSKYTGDNRNVKAHADHSVESLDSDVMDVSSLRTIETADEIPCKMNWKHSVSVNPELAIPSDTGNDVQSLSQDVESIYITQTDEV